ncbi:hypothetical protein [Nitrosomonas sp.]|uniref:hypothetical protein n=1 Tax=Nitrosomonas sp. TaxID=42353 RepID=UPI002842B75A|nr:hypothetical protein [Nitrosomonas sp.]MDR4515746.1 hypothetical protein [Nitrosomonas sp.]
MQYTRKMQQWMWCGCLCVLVAFSLSEVALSAPRSDTKIVMVIDDSGTVRKTEKDAGMTFEAMKEELFATLARLRTQARFFGASVDVFVSSSGALVWSGKLADLQSAKGLTLQKAIQGQGNRCNDLEKTFQAIDHHLRFLNEDRFPNAKIFFLTGGFHSGTPCAQFKKIIYPSDLPAGVDFGAILTQKSAINTIVIMGLHPAMQEKWGGALAPLLAWQKEQPGRVFELYTDVQTPTALARGLEGVTQ